MSEPIDIEKPKDAAPPPEKNHKRRKALILFTLGLVFIALCWFLLWHFYLRFYESTDDAYANGNMVNINTAISGSVIAYFADDTDLVKEGELLVQLDPTEYQIHYEKELANLAATVLHVRELYDNVPAAKANMEHYAAEFSKSQYDYNNRLQLIDFNAISHEDFKHSQDTLNATKASFEQAMYQLQMALDAKGNTSIELHPLILEQKNNVRAAFYELQHCNIYAPSTGYIAQRTVEVGQWATPITNLMAIIPMDYLWVDANFKETQLAHMRIGQRASVWFDLYGSKNKFEGKVLGIASGTGSVFSIIPPQNATGNWIKIVQRLPVRISLDPEMIQKFPPRLGISANVVVDLTEQDLPFLADVPKAKSIATTSVFKLPMQEVEQIMDRVINENLKKS